ncbi:MAG: hypothetical protein ACR2N3_00660 [Pyrinomonadaceae bacterium]
MNSEELEISLRSEFENYLKDVFAEMRQEISQLQTKIETELENHKTQLDGVFREALSRADADRNFDAGFKDSVVEHLRLARDEGARITATAIAEAEEMDRQSAVPTAGIKELHAAVNDISSKNSQSEILKTLVQHASAFAPRGAFFIIKNEHFVGWRTFGSEDGASEEAVREVFMPVSSDSILSEAVRSLATVESNSETFSDDAAILNKLNFGAPDKMFAIPLVARGRGVAVLYVDYGEHGGEVNVEALETMVHVAGLTVEVLASSRGGTSSKKKTASEHSQETVAKESARETVRAETGFSPSHNVPVAEPSETNQYQPSLEDRNEHSYAEDNVSELYSDEPSHAPENAHQNFVSDDYETAESGEEKNFSEAEKPTDEYPATPAQTEENYPAYNDGGWNQPTGNLAPAEEKSSDYETSAGEQSSWSEPAETPTPMISAQEFARNYVKEADEQFPNYSFEPPVESEPQPYKDFAANPVNDYQVETPKAENFDSFVPQTETYAPAPEINRFKNESAKPSESFAEPVAAAPPVSAPTVRSRFSERNVDLPIEVSEDERRLHNDARRFARLLVSEIKLYNEQKVKEGREGNDLYERLREAIDRSREMYDKRVQPPVAAKFDYFHYELVNTLAEGDGNRLGESYPGANV